VQEQRRGNGFSFVVAAFCVICTKSCQIAPGPPIERADRYL